MNTDTLPPRRRSRPFRRTSGEAPPPQDADAQVGPLRRELFGPDRLAEHARQLARGQQLEPLATPRLRRPERGLLLARLDDTERVLTWVRETLVGASRAGVDMSPAGAWLLDNFFVVLEHVREIRANMPSGYYHELPKLSTGPLAGYPRVYELAIELIAHTDGRLDGQNIDLMMREFQRVVPLTLGELWAWPAMLRMGLLENVRRMALRTARDVTDAEEADRWVVRFHEAAIASDTRSHAVGEPVTEGKPPLAGHDSLSRELEAFVNQPPELTPAFLTRFLREIRTRRADFTPLLWLEQWIAEDAMTVEEAVQRSTQGLSLTQLVMANSITSLRSVASFDWRDFVESASVTESVLRRDPARLYAGMTFETRDGYRHVIEAIAKRTRRSEPDVAEAAIVIAEATRAPGPRERVSHVGFYLVDDGRALLESAMGYRTTWRERMRRRALRHPNAVYFGALAAAVIGALLLALSPLPDDVGFVARIAAALLALVPASEAAIAVVNQLVVLLVPPGRLPRLDYESGVAAADRTVVAVPLLLPNVEAVRDALDHLEAQYLANRDPEVRFALLGDLTDADRETLDDDANVTAAVAEGVRALNEIYGASSPPFYAFLRPRRWNPREGVWMGWERKRGKLGDFNAYLLGVAREAFTIVVGDAPWLAGVRYVITLDADTVLPRGAAATLVGTMAHPLNRPEFDAERGRVIRGYGILQPRVSVTLESANRSRYATMFAGHPGVDPYTTAVSDVYQDLYCEGTFTGKGIYDLAVFERSTQGRFPENALLSHDLIEGAFARAGLVTDVEVFDDYPSRYLTASRRQHRWIRGDWQLLPWLGRWVPGPSGATRNPLSTVSRWKIADNLRRSVWPVSVLIWWLASWTILPGPATLWSLAVLVALATPWAAAIAIALLRPPRNLSWAPYYAAVWRDARSAMAQLGLSLIFLPHQALVALDAIGRTLGRLLVSRRHLLEWQTASHAERTAPTNPLAVWARMLPGVAVGWSVLFLCALAVSRSPHPDMSSGWLILGGVGILWTIAPQLAHRLSLPHRQRDRALAPEERDTALRYARLHWDFFDRLVTADTHWLAPDNLQETPEPVMARRTSPTNIGLQLLSLVSAYDLELLGRGELLDRLERAFDSLHRMRRTRGHFYNWYDLADLRVLDPPYVSTVDSGNLAGHLLALSEACLEIAEGSVDSPDDAGRLHALQKAAHDMAMAMDFRLLYDSRKKLFSIGYDERANRLDSSSYDLLASEARLASFVAVAKGDVPAEHWFRLGRSLTTEKGATALVSWSGSMFEYLMPVLVMPSHGYSLLDQTHHAAVRRQIAYGRARGVPWGISECAYNLRDRHETYQYRAFGVPDLALKRGLADDLVVAPYAAALALMVAPHEALSNLGELERQQALGAYGFYDALDYTRPDPPGTHAVVRAWMAHHVGMSLVALDNALSWNDGQGVWQRRFMRDAVSRAAALLLDERVPRRYVAQQPQSDAPGEDVVAERPVRAHPVVREFDTAHTDEPRVGLLGALPYCLLISNAGGGYSRSNGMAVTRWRADSTRDDSGQWLYLRDLATGRLWSASHQPTAAVADQYRVAFAADRVRFTRRDGAVDTRLEIVVIPRERAEIRRVTVTNRSREVRDIELTSYAEIVLTTPDADRAHPAFQNLFVETEWVSSCSALLASRRPRSSGEARPWLAHVLAAGGERVGAVTCETDRARFIGRGRSIRSPLALDAGMTLSGSVGAVLDPIASLRVRVTLEPGRSATVAFTTVVAENREEALQNADRYRDLRAADRALALSGTEAQMELRDFDVTPAEAALYQELAGALIYPHEALGASQAERAANRRGQRALWAHGISGDWPIVLGTIGDAGGLPSVRQLLVAHKYWRMKGITSDLVILNTKTPTYQQELHDQIVALTLASTEGAIVDRPGGVFVRRGDLLAAEDLAMLRATARIAVVCDGVGLGEVMEPNGEIEWQTDRLRGSAREPTIVRVPPSRGQSLDETPPWPVARAGSGENGFGRLVEKGDYEILVSGAHLPPAPWVNIVANPRAGFCVTERGGGFAWAENSYFYRLTPWHNDPVGDPCGEVIYLQDADSGRSWTPTPGPAAARGRSGAPSYTVRHGPGVTTFSHEREGIASELTLAVPEEDPAKISRLRLTNRGSATRRLTITSFVEWALGVSREHTRHQIHTRRNEATGALLGQNYFADDFASRVAFSWMSERVTSFTGDREEFIGRNGDLVAPAALAQATLSGATGAGYDPCAALRGTIALAPGETREVVLLLGAAIGEEEVHAIIGRLGAPGAASAAIDTAVRRWDDRLSTLTARTPSPEFDAMLNRWSLYQALACRMWARSALYQSSGAYGFRDQLQDCMAFVYAEPGITRAHLIRSASRQFREGDVQHWWHEPTGNGVRTRISDDLVWLPHVADHYVRVTGDQTVWDERIPFLSMRLLAPGEQEAYELPEVSEESATLYEHCVRALDRAATAGSHGLPLIGCGDWNDGMNRVGVGGTGESVWLAWFLIATLRRFALHAEGRGDAATAARLRSRADDYNAAVEREAWDGSWYRRAYFDDGTPLGSRSSDECRIDAIAQSWSVLSEAGDPVRAREAMRAVGEQLVREDARLIMLLTPPFDHSARDPGYIKGYVPGVRENGAQYTHAALWTALATARMGDGDRAFHLLQMLNPLTHAATPEGAARYKVEPYAVCADVYTADGHVGRGGWTWYTGSASWSYRVALEGILGFTKRGDRLTLDPCVPTTWREFSLTYRYGATTYSVEFRNPDAVARGVAIVELDGRRVEDGQIQLRDDGVSHSVRVTLGAPEVVV
ncbi:MAG: carbohydrate-binding protein [Gemmatimonadota bacterium]|nr:carbohydrate-binding protein [Gemmatimonadota bacterium]